MGRPVRRSTNATVSAAKLRRLRRDRLTPEEYVQLFPPGRRCDRMVLRDIAAKADWSQSTWGASAFPSVPAIAERTGYCVRSVQYALRRLCADGHLELVERPGRTNVCRVLRHLELVAGEDAGDNPVSEAPASSGPVAPGGAKVAPDLGPLPNPNPPKGPLRPGKGKLGGANAPAQAPPERRGAPPDDHVTTEPPPAAPGAPRLRPAGSQEPVARATGLAGPRPWLYGPSGLRKRTPGPNRARRRDLIRESVGCPECKAAPGENCRREDGTTRSSNHKRRGPLNSILHPG